MDWILCSRVAVVETTRGFTVKAVFPKHVGAYSMRYGRSGIPRSAEAHRATPFRRDETFPTEGDARRFMESRFRPVEGFPEPRPGARVRELAGTVRAALRDGVDPRAGLPPELGELLTEILDSDAVRRLDGRPPGHE